MSRSKLFNMVKSRGEQKQGRNPFDLTNRHVYSQKVAKIVPVKAIGTYPDDYFDIEVSEFTQNKIPMNRAAFLSGKKELLAYFVPYNSIWHNFNQFMATREDPDSTLLYERGISYEPRMALSDLYYAAFVFYNWYYMMEGNRKYDVLYYFTDNVDEDFTELHALVSAYLGAYTSDGYYKADDVITAMQSITDYNFLGKRQSVSIYELAESSYLSYLKRVTFDVLINNYSFNLAFQTFDNIDETPITDVYKNVVGNYFWCDWIQKLDMLGYGNLYPFFKTYETSLSSFADKMFVGYECFISNNIVAPPRLFNSEHTEVWKYYERQSPLWHSILNDGGQPDLWNILNDYKGRLEKLARHYDDDGVSFQEEYVNVYPIYAYNRCFYDYMRNVYYDTDYSPYNYNCDFINGRSLEGSIIKHEDLPLRWYQLEMHQWKKDMFTGVLPDNQLGQVSEVFLSGQMITDVNGKYFSASGGAFIVSGPASFAPTTDGSTINDQATGDPVVHYHNIKLGGDSENVASFNVLALKRAEAIQQYRQDLMRAGNRTKDVFNQVFGITPKSELDESPYFIEVASQDINVNPIISTAQTGNGSNQSLGDIAARVTLGGNSLRFKFSTKDFGVLLILSYIIPDSYYNSYRIDPFNTHLDQESHGLPYFQNLGLQPVIGSSLSNYGDADSRKRILGYAPPYIEFKTDIDLVHGDFVDAYLESEELNETTLPYQGEMSPWVVARTDMQIEKAVSLRNFYINPKVLDNVFEFNSGDDYSTDHFFSHCIVKVDAVRPFSELGLPRF